MSHTLRTLEVPVMGMDCAECTQHVQRAIAQLPGVEAVNVFLTSEKAVIRLDPARVDLPAIRKPVASAGNYSVPDTASAEPTASLPTRDFNRQLVTLLVGVFGMVLSIVFIGEWLGVFKALGELVPFPIGVVLVMVGGWPIFRNVIRATLKRQVIAHTLMTIGALAALAVGEWVTAASWSCSCGWASMSKRSPRRAPAARLRNSPAARRRQPASSARAQKLKCEWRRLPLAKP